MTTGHPKILFLYLKAFSGHGGIEQVNRTLMQLLHELSLEDKIDIQAVSPYDTKPDIRYFPESRFSGYEGSRWRFMRDMLRRNRQADVVIAGHINLAPAVHLLKIRNPKLRVIVLAHGIEVWRPPGRLKRRLLKIADRIIAVSAFTRNKLMDIQDLPADKIAVLPNCFDPLYRFPRSFSKPAYLLERYQVSAGQPVLFTLCRLSASEAYKGYDKVIQCLPYLLKDYPGLLYIIGGRYDPAEKQRLDQLIQLLHLEQHVLLTGFIPDTAVSDHYHLSDVFVMPSTGEGFGLVFLEALAHGIPVVAGNADGSAEALLDGRLGLLVDPGDPAAIAEAIRQSLLQPGDPAERQQAVKAAFNYSEYKARLENILFSPA